VRFEPRLRSLLRERPADMAMDRWLAAIADLLLHDVDLVVAGARYRLREVELYYHGGLHLDPFAHRDPLQTTSGRWYFHRSGGSYRGGSFKGLDITFGPDDAHGGVLLRTIESDETGVINGCSLCVDHLLERAGAGTVTALDSAIEEREVWDAASPLALRPSRASAAPDVVATARVGLTLKRAVEHTAMPRYIMRPYRFVTDLALEKGKVHTVIALHHSGRSPETIAALTGSTRGRIARCLEEYAVGLSEEGFVRFIGRALSTADLSRLHGVWYRAFGANFGAV